MTGRGPAGRLIVIARAANDTKARAWPARVRAALARVQEPLDALDHINDIRYPAMSPLPGEREVDRALRALRKLTERWDAGEDVAADLEAAVLDWGDLAKWVVKMHRSRPRLRLDRRRGGRGRPRN